MILTDAGPLIALIDRGEPDHNRCRLALASLTGPMVTTWPAFTDAIYLLGSAAGWPGQDPLWRLLLRGDLELAALDQALIKRSYALMEKYRDVPMDLADATLVSVAEAWSITQVFTLDADFQVYRLKGRQAFQIVP
jgi:uncharacterized protein